MITNRQKIDTLIISDTHLGEEDVRSQEILNLLNKYDFKRLVLNGDILDGLSFERFHSRHWQILSTFRELSKTCEVVWVHGNHDVTAKILSKLLGVKVYHQYTWYSDGKKCLAMHGHQFDRFMHDNIILSHIAFAFYGFFKKHNKTKFITNIIKSKSNTWKRNSIGVAQGALQYGAMMRASLVFCGHTHQLNKIKVKGIEYYNTGSWVESPSGYVIIDKGQAELRTK